MKWFLAKLVFRIVCGHGEHTAQFDEQLRLIAASNENQAFEKASTMGLDEGETFYNQITHKAIPHGNGPGKSKTMQDDNLHFCPTEQANGKYESKLESLKW